MKSVLKRGFVLVFAALAVFLGYGCGDDDGQPIECNVPDCHSAGDNDLGRSCCSRNRSNGTWQLNTLYPDRPRHCCR
jgi:hypothetical protein